MGDMFTGAGASVAHDEIERLRAEVSRLQSEIQARDRCIEAKDGAYLRWLAGHACYAHDNCEDRKAVNEAVEKTWRDYLEAK